MSASINDTGLSVTSYGKTAFYSGTKGFGNILIEPQFGLYDNKKPYAHTALNFISKLGCSWEEHDNFQKLNTPLEHPIYGTIDVNFDTKTVIDNNGYGDINCYYPQWIEESARVALKARRDEYEFTALSKKAMLEHLKNKRFEFYDINQNRENRLKISYPDDLKEFLEFIEINSNYSAVQRILMIWIKLPEGWNFISSEEESH